MPKGVKFCKCGVANGPASRVCKECKEAFPPPAAKKAKGKRGRKPGAVVKSAKPKPSTDPFTTVELAFANLHKLTGVVKTAKATAIVNLPNRAVEIAEYVNTIVDPGPVEFEDSMVLVA
jgi:hypothetical protein